VTRAAGLFCSPAAQAFAYITRGHPNRADNTADGMLSVNDHQWIVSPADNSATDGYCSSWHSAPSRRASPGA